MELKKLRCLGKDPSGFIDSLFDSFKTTQMKSINVFVCGGIGSNLTDTMMVINFNPKQPKLMCFPSQGYTNKAK